jgi:hypothetical protein
MPLVLLLGSTNNALESRFVLDCIFNWMLLSSLSSKEQGLSSNALGEKEILNLSGGAAIRLVISNKPHSSDVEGFLPIGSAKSIKYAAPDTTNNWYWLG